MNSKGATIMKFSCKLKVFGTKDPYFSNCVIEDIEVLYKHPESEYDEREIIKKLLGKILIKNSRYFFYIDVKDHLKVFRRLTNLSEEEDAYPKFLPWVEKETYRLLLEQKRFRNGENSKLKKEEVGFASI